MRVGIIQPSGFCYLNGSCCCGFWNSIAALARVMPLEPIITCSCCSFQCQTLGEASPCLTPSGFPLVTPADVASLVNSSQGSLRNAGFGLLDYCKREKNTEGNNGAKCQQPAPDTHTGSCFSFLEEEGRCLCEWIDLGERRGQKRRWC